MVILNNMPLFFKKLYQRSLSTQIKLPLWALIAFSRGDAPPCSNRLHRKKEFLVLLMISLIRREKH